MRSDRSISVIYTILCFAILCFAQTDIYDSGGPLMPEQAAYDVTYYDLHLSVFPKDSSIQGYVTINAHIVQPIDYFVVDLDTLLKINKVTETLSGKEKSREFARETGKVWIGLRTTRQPGESVSIKIFYGGKPLVAKRPPWDGGFTWARTNDDQPWIGTSCQGEGPDIWWPVKDHISDKPDSMGIHIRVPDPLFCASNGKLISVEKNKDHTTTYHWFVSTPINNYCVALNIAPYRLIEQQYTSTCGDVFPVKFWVLPQDYEKGVKIFPEFIKHLRFLERNLGPYPFRADKCGFVQTPYLGMEHQTIVAYGANFNNKAYGRGTDWGFDILQLHELSHEWWGNLVTNADWKDSWIHEGFATYMEALYVEKISGMKGYHQYIKSLSNFTNTLAVAPEQSQTTNMIWKAPIYDKGATILHVLRHLIGDENFKESLRLMAYPDPAMEKITDGRQVRFVTTNDFVTITEHVSGMDLDWFFNLYVHQPLLPQLDARVENDSLIMSWVTPDNMPFPMPIDVKIGDKIERIEMKNGENKIKINPGMHIQFDPEKWGLYEPVGLHKAVVLVEQQKFDQAKELFSKILFISPENTIVKKMDAYLEYALKNGEKVSGTFFNSDLISYKSKTNRIYSFSYKDDNFYMSTSRGKYKMYPVSDNEFVFKDFDGRVTFSFNQEHIRQMIFEMGSRVVKAQAVE